MYHRSARLGEFAEIMEQYGSQSREAEDFLEEALIEDFELYELCVVSRNVKEALAKSKPKGGA